MEYRPRGPGPEGHTEDDLRVAPEAQHRAGEGAEGVTPRQILVSQANQLAMALCLAGIVLRGRFRFSRCLTLLLVANGFGLKLGA